MKRTPTPLLMLCFCLLVAFVAAACGDDTATLADGDITKDNARELMASSRTTDLCEARGWYGDGTCDDFCPEVDPDCGPTETVDPVERVDLEPEPYNPCAGKTCGDTCNLCPPNDPDCIETAVVKYCTADGACSARMPECSVTPEPEPYNPCAGKTCGDTCTHCSPDDPDCIETAVVKYCTADGACNARMPVCSVTPDPEPYNPCAGKTCGEQCTHCPPGDADCIETAVVKFCTDDGLCSPRMPACSM